MFTKTLRNYLPLILIIILASVLRLYALGEVPISMSDDEIRSVYTAYSIAQTGKDTFGNFMPLVFKMDGANTFGQVPIYISSLFFIFLKLSSFSARLPFALSGILSVIILYLILKKLLNNNKIALFSSFVLSVSVWNIQITRFAIETGIAAILYLIGIWLFLVSKKRISIFLFSMLFFFLGFYAYAAVKITLIPILSILFWYKFKDFTKKHLIIVIITITLSFGSFWYLSITQQATSYSGAGGHFFLFQDKEATSKAVELERRVSNEPNIIETLYHNKYTYWTRTFAANYLATFSPQYLFLNQEASGIYSIWGRGEFYLFELPLILIGAFYLFVKKRKEFFLIFSFLLISPLPSALGIGSPTWTSRSFFTLFWLCSLAGTGIYALFDLPKKKIYKFFILGVIFLLYFYSLIGYVSQYYFDWSRTNAKYFSKSTQDLAYSLNRYKNENKNVVVSGATENTLLHYAFYNKSNPQLVQKSMAKSPIKFENFIFMNSCFVNPGDNPYNFISNNSVYISLNENCKYDATPSSRILTFDKERVIWNIYEK